jgi:hypothetical protein
MPIRHGSLGTCRAMVEWRAHACLIVQDELTAWNPLYCKAGIRSMLAPDTTLPPRELLKEPQVADPCECSSIPYCDEWAIRDDL